MYRSALIKNLFYLLTVVSFVSCKEPQDSRIWKDSFETAKKHYEAKEYLSALEFLNKSLENLEDSSFYEIALVNLYKSNTYLGLYKSQDVRSSANLALEACKRKRDKTTEVLIPSIYMNIAFSYFLEGDNDTSIQFFSECLSLIETKNSKDRALFDIVMGLVGRVYYEKGEIEVAIRHFKEAITQDLQDAYPEQYSNYQDYLGFLIDEHNQNPSTDISRQKGTSEQSHKFNLEIENLILKRDLESIKNENEKLNEQNWELSNGQWFAIILLFIITIGGLWLYQRETKNKELREKQHQEEKERIQYENNLPMIIANKKYSFELKLGEGEKIEVNIKYGDLIYIQKLNRSEYVKILLKDGRKFKGIRTIKAFEAELPKSVFHKVNRSFIINILERGVIKYNVEKGKREMIIEIGDLEIEVPRRKQKEIRQIFSEHRSR